ncbi:MAG: hypothetical protein IKB89_03365 [Clostridia bacterium]|nr:hypothetical protein [Clostridia bacterium]
MNFEKGMIVKPQSGHRINKHFVLVETDENFVYIADGKRKRLSNPKKKNKKHVVVTDKQKVDLNTQTDKSIRKLLNKYDLDSEDI